MKALGSPSERLAGGVIPRRIGDKGVPSQVIGEIASVRPGAIATPAGFLASIPNRSPARARGLAPRSRYPR